MAKFLSHTLRKALFLNDQPLMRDIEAGRYLESFLVASITTVLIVRSSLYVTGYPSIAIGGIHIAHVLIGGFFLTLSITLLLGFLGKPAKHIGSVFGGIGFGEFIDELGKFVTQDNDYFFELAPALIYTSFVVLYLSFRAVSFKPKVTEKEYLVNALEALQEAVAYDLDENEKQRAAELLNLCNPNDPLVVSIRQALERFQVTAPARPSLPGKAKYALRNVYRRLVQQSWFLKGIILLFVLQSVTSILQALALLTGPLQAVLQIFIILLVVTGLVRIFIQSSIFNRFLLLLSIGIAALLAVLWVPLVFGLAEITPDAPTNVQTFAETGELISSAIAGAFVVYGILRLQGSRLAAFRLFRTAILISIFLTQFFAFYQAQFLAVTGLLLNIAILAALNYAIEQEKHFNQSG